MMFVSLQWFAHDNFIDRKVSFTFVFAVLYFAWRVVLCWGVFIDETMTVKTCVFSLLLLALIIVCSNTQVYSIVLTIVGFMLSVGEACQIARLF